MRALLIFLVTLVPIQAPVDPPRPAAPFPIPAVSERGLVGTIGPHRVRMMLSCWGEGELEGSYYIAREVAFARNWNTDIRVRGTVDAKGRFRMEESAGQSLVRESDEEAPEAEPKAEPAPDVLLDNYGVMTGTLTIQGPGPRRTVRLVGAWALPDGSKSLPVTLAEVSIPRPFRINTKTFSRSNDRIRTHATATYPSLAGRPAFEREIFGEIRLLESILRRNADQDIEGVDKTEYSTLDIDYEVTAASPTFVSVMFRCHYWYTVYVTHSRLEQWGYTYDLRRGRALTLRDLFGAGYQRTLGKTVRGAVVGTYWDMDVTGAPKEIDGADFYLVDGGVMLIFPVDRSLGGVVEIFVPERHN